MGSDSTQAQEYADVIAQELRELEAALIAARAYVEAEADEAPYFDGVTFADADEVIGHYVNYLALEVSEVTRTSYYAGGSTRVRSFVEVTRTVGGPGAFVDFDGRGFATVRVYWGSQEAQRGVLAPNVDTELWELMDALSGVAAAY